MSLSGPPATIFTLAVAVVLVLIGFRVITPDLYHAVVLLTLKAGR